MQSRRGSGGRQSSKSKPRSFSGVKFFSDSVYQPTTDSWPTPKKKKKTRRSRRKRRAAVESHCQKESKSEKEEDEEKKKKEAAVEEEEEAAITPKRWLLADPSFVDMDLRSLFQLIVLYLPHLDAERFTSSFVCFRPRSEQAVHSLLLWKQLYHRDYGVIRFQYKRRTKVNRQKQLDKHHLNLSRWPFWEKQYEKKRKQERRMLVQFEERGRLSLFSAEESNTSTLLPSTMIIVTKFSCEASQLLELAHFRWSNWYDVEETHSKYQTRRSSRCPIENGVGFDQINVDQMMRNLAISSSGWSEALAFPVRYIKYRCHLLQITPGGKEKRQCVVVPMDTARDTVLNAVVFDRILNLDELQIRFLNLRKLIVVVYGMAFRAPRPAAVRNFQENQSLLDYVVVDYVV